MSTPSAADRMPPYVDYLAIGIGLFLALLVRSGLIPAIGF
jgi:hypothetical protein